MITPELAWVMVYVILGATVVTYFLNLWAVKRAQATRVALYIFLQPVIAAVLGVVFRGEDITPRFLVATALVFAALFLRDGAPKDEIGAVIAGKTQRDGLQWNPTRHHRRGLLYVPWRSRPHHHR